MTTLKTALLALSVFCAAGASLQASAGALSTEDSCKEWLATQTSVTTALGDTYNLSTLDARGAFSMSNASIQYGLPDFLRGDLQTADNKVAGAGAKKIGKQFASILATGKALESIKEADVLQAGDELDHFKSALNFVINNFCWKNGKPTEVTADEVASLYCVRHRLIDYKKALG